MNGEDLFVET